MLPPTLDTFLTSLVVNARPHSLQLKSSPTFSGAPFKDVNEVQLWQPKCPPNSFGAPSKDVNDLQ